MNRRLLCLSRWHLLAVVLVMTLSLADGQVTSADGSGMFSDSGQSLGSSNSLSIAQGDIDQLNAVVRTANANEPIFRLPTVKDMD